ncbi:NEDD8-activating enzyme E1 regulatory subunit [Octopus sinensis]|uniref:NEDD8-activating enzyme E1 regulatory subunit n=1 Tax=Octopus sinensis TaxID=2607531 RepID=A0A6P7SEK2_9MOLL|nr:NEDD8-activating enzyme E1 regulatory subunit [Octopus sinensis]
MATTTAASPTSENKVNVNRYDRQLRLWGDHGQACLENAKVCLINATATGTEILKNLVLPGIGSFTIVDGDKVTGADVGNNFFLAKDTIGQSRAHVATNLLMELNEEVSGDYVEESPEKLLESNPEFFNRFTLVVATNLHEKPLLQLAANLREADIPLLICRSYGFIGYARIVAADHTIIESHPDNSHEDLRLDCPFPGLIDFCDKLNLNDMDKKEHSHVPWLVIIYKYLQKWKEEHNGEPPKNYKEKTLMKETIRNGVLINENGNPEEEQNFDEAVENLNTSLVRTHIPETVQKIFNDPSCTQMHADSKNFWIMLHAMKEFTENEGKSALPLRGTIPDMTADSNRYIQLQNIYREQAHKDVTNILHRVQNILQKIGKPYCSITEQDVKLFCKNGSFLRVIHCRSLAEEYDPKSAQIQEGLQLGDEEDSDIVFYLMLRAAERFFEEYSRYPGWYDDQVEGDVFKLKTHVSKLLMELGLSSTLIKDDYIHEMCRYGASELHSIAAYMGGVMSQEAIKIITGQFVPFNNTLIYNAMKQCTTTLEL